jgi:hypothetical protein
MLVVLRVQGLVPFFPSFFQTFDVAEVTIIHTTI